MHVARPRLIRRLSAAPVALIEAGGGYGKSVLAARVAAVAWDRVRRGGAGTRGGAGADELVGALRRGLRRAGLSDAAAALTRRRVWRTSGRCCWSSTRSSGRPARRSSCLVALASRLPEQHRLLLVGRRLDPRCWRCALSAPSASRPEELAFDDDELAELLGGAGEPRRAVAHLRRVRRAGRPRRWSRRCGSRATGPSRAGRSPQLLDGLLAGRRPRAAGAAGAAAAALACGRRGRRGPGSADAAAATPGCRCAPGGPGWLELPDPVREALAGAALDWTPRGAGRGGGLRGRGRAVRRARAARRRRRRRSPSCSLRGAGRTWRRSTSPSCA